MLIDELNEELKSAQTNFQTIENFLENSKFDERFKTFEKQINTENFWQNPNQAQILKKFQALKHLKEKYEELRNNLLENKELLELFKDNEKELNKIKPDIQKLTNTINKFKLELFLRKSDDLANCFLSINPGAGGTESQDWANMLLRMYLRFCEKENFDAQIIDYQSGDEAGIKSATLFIKGKYAYGFLKSENGIHRLVRISPFDSNKRRHTSFAAVNIVPEASEEKIEIDEKDLRIDTYRASGAGGQHVNKTDSAVRITHIPTKIVVQCQNERSQLQNKKTAMKLLTSKLIEKQKEEQQQKEKSIEKKKIEWGSQIRSYVLHPYKMVKDLRTNYETPQPDLILDGELMPLIESYLVKFAGNK